MDPVACWKEIIDLLSCGSHEEEADRGDLAYYLRSLADWIDKGGFIDFDKLLDYAKDSTK